MSAIITRRALLTTGALGAGALLSGCDQVANTPSLRKILFSGEKMNYGLARADRSQQPGERISARPDVANLPCQRHQQPQYRQI